MTKGKSAVAIAVLGEKDHGKSTFIGRLLYETDSIPRDRVRDVREIAGKMGKEFEWAHLLDSFRYERVHDMTLDTTRAIVKKGSRLYEFIDVPGHEELARNMVTGASNAHNAVLIISAESGIEAQTLRHLDIARLLGISRLIIVVNKCDLIDYSQKRFNAVARQIRTEASKRGYAASPVIPVVARTGENVLRRSSKLAWYRGKTFMETVRAHFPARSLRAAKGFLMPVQDVYGSVVVGRVEQGNIRRGGIAHLFPHGSRHRINRISIGNKEAASAQAGATVGLSFDPAPKLVRRGDVVSDRKSIRATKHLRCRAFFFDAPKRLRYLEADFQKIRILHVAKRIKALSLVSLVLSLEKAVRIPARVLIRNDTGRIVGFGVTR